MATLTIRNIPDDLLEKLERSANKNRRALDEEAVIWLSHVEVPETPEPRSSDDTLEELRDKRPDAHITRSAREGGLGYIEDDSYMIIPSPMESEEFIEYTQRLNRNLKGKVWVTEEELNRSKSEGRLGSETGESNREPDPWLERARALRESMPDVHIGDEEELNRFKREGRL